MKKLVFYPYESIERQKTLDWFTEKGFTYLGSGLHRIVFSHDSIPNIVFKFLIAKEGLKQQESELYYNGDLPHAKIIASELNNTILLQEKALSLNTLIKDFDYIKAYGTKDDIKNWFKTNNLQNYYAYDSEHLRLIFESKIREQILTKNDAKKYDSELSEFNIGINTHGELVVIDAGHYPFSEMKRWENSGYPMTSITYSKADILNLLTKYSNSN